jgi:hypothetical protein
VINAQKLLLALPHDALRGEQFFGRSLVARAWVRGNIAQAINRSSLAPYSADESTTLSRACFTRMRVHLFDMRGQKRNHALLQKRSFTQRRKEGTKTQSVDSILCELFSFFAPLREL